MIDFLRTLANAGGTSGASDSSRVIIRKIEEIPLLHYADKLNEIILSEEFYTAAIFLNGDFSVDYVDDKTYTCSYELYFQDKQNETYKIEAKSKPLDAERLSLEVREDLQVNGSVKFEIPAPSEEVRKSYKLVRK